MDGEMSRVSCMEYDDRRARGIQDPKKGRVYHFCFDACKKAESITTVEKLNETRIHTDMEECNRVLGGGLVQGSLVLIGGDPVLANLPYCFRYAVS